MMELLPLTTYYLQLPDLVYDVPVSSLNIGRRRPSIVQIVYLCQFYNIHFLLVSLNTCKTQYNEG